jgi:hypothetical protein
VTLEPRYRVECQRSWEAHPGCFVTTLQYIAEPASLLSAGTDRLVKIWSLMGECLGALTHVGMRATRTRRRLTVAFLGSRQGTDPLRHVELFHQHASESEAPAARSEASRQRSRQARRKGASTPLWTLDSGNAVCVSSRQRPRSKRTNNRTTTTTTPPRAAARRAASPLPVFDCRRPRRHVPHMASAPSLLACSLTSAFPGGSGTYVRRTPRRKPIDVMTAGKGLSSRIQRSRK